MDEEDENVDEPKPTGVITLLNNYTGAIEVMASGIPFEEEQYNLATQGKRNPGSAFKSITLLAALETGSHYIVIGIQDHQQKLTVDIHVLQMVLGQIGLLEIMEHLLQLIDTLTILRHKIELLNSNVLDIM